MSDHEFQDALKTLLDELAFMDADDLDQCDLPDDLAGIERVRTFAEAGVLTDNAGLVIETADGGEYQVTIVQSG
ncbi:MAG: hypothetical protein ACP5HU_12905 [Phycisphaerae bacterium]